jgi:hypothetical protein
MTLWTAEDYAPLPPGLYVGELLDIESRESANGAYRRWGWKIEEGPYAGRKVYANTSTNFGPQAKARQWVENILGRELEAGEQIGTEDLVGDKHHLMVENVKRDGRTFDNVSTVHKYRELKPTCGAALLAAPPPTEGVIALYMKEQTAPNKRLLLVKVENIPEELRVRPQWVVWKAVGDKPDKVPYSARTGHRASSTDLLTWGTFEEALEAYENGEYAGLGFVFSSADPYTGIDLDNCVDEDGEIAGWALETVRYFDSYTELSATGTGLHIIVRGEVPNRKKGDVEVYSSKRFFTVTGHAVEVSGD